MYCVWSFPGIFQEFSIVGAVAPACCLSPAERRHGPAVVHTAAYADCAFFGADRAAAWGGGPASKRPHFERVASDVDLAAFLFIDVNIFVDTAVCYIIYYYIW